MKIIGSLSPFGLALVGAAMVQPPRPFSGVRKVKTPPIIRPVVEVLMITPTNDGLYDHRGRRKK